MAATTNYNKTQFQTHAYNSTTVSRTATETKATNTAAWALQIFLGLAFLFFGAMKLGGAEKMVAMFHAIGLGQWLRYVTGTVEFVSAILLFSPRTAAVGAFLIGCTMVGAIATNLLLIGSNPLLPVVFLALSAALVALRWNRASATIHQENVVNV